MIVLDAEPLIALVFDEPGSDAVGRRLGAIEAGERQGCVNTVTCTELRYVLAADTDEATAEQFVSRIRSWCRVVDAESVWQTAARFKTAHSVSLGDAFVLGTAAETGGTAYVGADDDFTGVPDVTVERFRTEPA